MVRFFCLLSVALPLSHCTNNEIAGGSTTSENALVGSVFDTAGVKISDAQILLIDNQNWLSKVVKESSVVYDSIRTNNSGSFTLNVPQNHPFNLQITASGQGLMVFDIHQSLDKDTTLNDFFLVPTSSLDGTVLPESGNVKNVLIAGTSYLDDVSSDSSFSFTDIPEGTYAFVSLIDAGITTLHSLGTIVSIRSGGSQTGLQLSAPVGRTIVENFTSKWKSPTNLGRVIGGGGWYTFRDDKDQHTDALLQIKTVSGTDAYSGMSLHAQMQLVREFTGLGFHIGVREKGYDLSKMTALSFWSKGTGTLRVNVKTTLIDSLEINNGHFGAVFGIPPDWTQTTIPTDSLYSSSIHIKDRGITWEQVAQSALRIEFVITEELVNDKDTVTVWLDDIAIDGLSLDDFASP